MVGEEGGVGFKETPPWFKTKRYFFVLKRCIFHVVSCKEWFFFVYYCTYLCSFFSGSLFLEQLFFNATLKIAHSSEFRISEKRSKYIIEEEKNKKKKKKIRKKKKKKNKKKKKKKEI